MGIFKATTDPSVSEREIRNGNAVRALAGDCMVLLKNDGTLPLKKAGKIALYGAGARGTVKGGTGSGDVYVRDSVTIEDGLTREGFTVTTGAWMARHEETNRAEFAEYTKKAAEEAAKSGIDAGLYMMLSPYAPVRSARITAEDVAASDTATAVYVIARNSGEGKDRKAEKGDYLLSDDEEYNLKFLAENYKKVIVLLNIGGVIDTKLLRTLDGINAVVLSNQMGNITGLTAADLLLGKAVPSGKLTDTWAENYSDYASSATFGLNDGDVEDEYYSEGIYTGYRYFDTFGIKPAFEFGFGLTYTSFEIGDIKVGVEKNEILVRAKVTNTGSEYAGREVVQIYVSSPDGKLDHPYQELKGFAKTKNLQPGESQVLTCAIKAESLASYSEEDEAWILEKGSYIVRVGNSSRNTVIAAAVKLDETVITEKARNLCLYKDELVKDLKAPERKVTDQEAAGIATCASLAINAADIASVTYTYTDHHEELKDAYPDHVITMDEVVSGKYTPAEMAAQLSDEDMAYLCVGNAVRNSGFSDVVGSASKGLPGAAGETTDRFEQSRNIHMLELCDGPAGVRVTPEFVELEDGTPAALFRNGEYVSEDQIPAGQHHYQYATAIPIAFALASSWDMDLIETCGSIVGGEMTEFGVSLWLAPGMNIHRNPLCGRNFEYYSEDPLLAGKCAAADTRGVQKYPGIGTTIKHFFANSQEDNRMFTNSHISERAIREIYLKNFRIAVTEAQPMSLMTSYNLVNGVHSANNIDALTNMLRDEWDFRGMVMTDWLTTSEMSKLLSVVTSDKYDKSDAAVCVKAGNDLIEPGEMADISRILEGIQDGTIVRADLQACAVRILTLISRSHLYSDKSYNEYAPGKCITFRV